MKATWNTSVENVKWCKSRDYLLAREHKIDEKLSPKFQTYSNNSSRGIENGNSTFIVVCIGVCTVRLRQTSWRQIVHDTIPLIRVMKITLFVLGVLVICAEAGNHGFSSVQFSRQKTKRRFLDNRPFRSVCCQRVSPASSSMYVVFIKKQSVRCSIGSLIYNLRLYLNLFTAPVFDTSPPNRHRDL